MITDSADSDDVVHSGIGRGGKGNAVDSGTLSLRTPAAGLSIHGVQTPCAHGVASPPSLDMRLHDKPYSPACDENKAPILAVLAPLFADARSVLEIGSGTGQHAVHFAAAMPHLTWQCSDQAVQLPGISLWLAEAGLPNTPPPLALDVDAPWPEGEFDAAFSANTVHIMSLPQVERLFHGVARLLPTGGPFVLYGPFSDGGKHSSDGNAQFDLYLRQRDPASGVRDLEYLRRVAAAAGLTLADDIPMPVNNRTLVWRRI
jgi:SAM-dependent methyltransferase